MSHHKKLDENIEGPDNFRAWKYMISLVLEENELDSYISGKVLVPEVIDFYHLSYMILGSYLREWHG